MKLSWFSKILGLVGLLIGACSSDEEHASVWTKDENNPVLRKGDPYAYDFYAISDCWVVYHEGIFKMWYTAGGAVLPDETLASRIAYATSSDGITWTKFEGNPVVDIRDDHWDNLGVETVSVIIDEQAASTARFKMWYAGQTRNDYTYEIGYAESADGKSWTRFDDPVLSVGGAGSWDNCFLEGPSVLKEGDQYKMWYAAYDCEINGEQTDGKVNIGFATSADGISWVKHPQPVLTTSADGWDKVYVQDPHVIYYNGWYHMWYGGADTGDHYRQQTGYAYSHDGITWTKSSKNPVVRRGTDGDWDANTCSYPSILIKENQIYMWYTGKDIEPLPPWPTPYFWEIGLARKPLGSGEYLD